MSEDEKKVRAPFTTDQCDSLNGFQRSNVMHPFTCKEHSNLCLIATREGWFCPDRTCSYEQQWAWTFMADWTWEEFVEQQIQAGLRRRR